MAQPIYRMFYSRMKEPWYQLSGDDQKALLGQVNAAMTQVGGKLILLCDSSWSSEKWLSWGVEEYPSLEALQEYAAALSNLDWFRYSEAETLLGTVIPTSG